MKFLDSARYADSEEALDRWFRSVSSATFRCLLLDFDGTLAPFTSDRLATRPYPGIEARLDALLGAERHRLALISGRPVAELESLLTLKSYPEIWGAHGWERLRAGASAIELHPMDTRQRTALDAARQWSITEGLEDWIELKPASVALHTRGREPGRAGDVTTMTRTAWRGSEESGMELHEFDGGLELRARGRDKGSVVREILAECPPDSVAAYLGDDRTDEDAFAALDGKGLCALVRHELRPTRADLWIVPPVELLEFLDRWIDAVRASPS